MLIVEGHKIQLNKNPTNLTNDELFEFCVLNKELRIERDANQNIIITALVGGNSGFYEKDLIFEIEYWVRKNKKGRSFSSSTGFLMPNGAMRSPDACWVSDARWQKVTEEQRKKFPPVVPDLIVEVRTPTDSLKGAKAKMGEWVESGIQLGWLIDVHNQQTFIHRADGSIQIIKGFDKKLSGEQVMDGFVLDLGTLKMP